MPSTPPHEPHRKPPLLYRKSAQFRAYAIRPYCNAILWMILYCVFCGGAFILKDVKFQF